MMRLIDSHCHIQFPAYNDDRVDVIKRSLAERVDMIVVGTDKASSLSAIEYASKYSGVYASVGFHPSDVVEKNWRSEILSIKEYIANKRVIAVGEIGFDTHRIAPDQKDAVVRDQHIVFDFLAEEARANNKQIIVHIRDAMEIFIKQLPALKKKGITGVVHCFSGTLPDAQKIIRAGFCIGFTGMITFNHSWDAVIATIPLEKILIETDAPFLTPVPHRGKRNEPLFVQEVARTIASIRETPYERVCEITYANAQTLFSL